MFTDSIATLKNCFLKTDSKTKQNTQKTNKRKTDSNKNGTTLKPIKRYNNYKYLCAFSQHETTKRFFNKRQKEQ